ncbi:hypothetical protein AGMMS50268_13720 [Spirochaetia bacterium]|nr:hypothetical protein AGMMS50268_13720 [Spirochaetia bacterium]
MAIAADNDEPATPPPASLNVDTLRRRIAREAASELMSLKLGDSEVALYMAGSWKGSLSGNFGVSRSPLGTQAVSPDSPVLFAQEADLTLSLWLRDRWFVEASFLDDYDINTYRAGYQGKEGEAVQYVGVGNTGLDFPAFPYLDLGGDSPSSFGLYGKFGGGKLKLHSLIRYDMASREERVFVGNRERTYSFVFLENPLRFRSFVLPDQNLDAPPVVYLEDEKGELRDTQGRRWRIAGASEYAASAVQGVLELGASPKGMVAVAYSRGGNRQPWTSSMGQYQAPGSGFLADAQQWFGSNIDLRNYPQPAQDAAAMGSSANVPGTVIIGGVPALALREGGAFSPFENLSRYQAPSSSSASVSLVSLSGGERQGGYDILPLDERVLSTELPLYATPNIHRGVYELAIEEPNRNRRDPRSLWPLGNKYPELYLPGNWKFSGDLGLRFTNYGSAGSYNIGTDVVPGSVQVLRSGIVDPRVNFDSNSGVVTLESPAGFNEVIRISYLKRSTDRRLGSLAAGAGVVYKSGGPFSSEIGLGLRWNVNSMPNFGQERVPESYTSEGVSNPGTVGLGAKAAWDYDHLRAQITAGLGFEQPDTTGLYRAAGMEGNEVTLSLPPESSFISEAPGLIPGGGRYGSLDLGSRSPLVYRNYLENTLGVSNLREIEWNGPVVSGKTGPYPVKDSKDHPLTAEFTFSPDQSWTGFEVPLGDNGPLLGRAKMIEVPFRFYDFSDTSGDFTVILQFGTLSDKERAFRENPSLIVEKQIYPPPRTDPNNPAAFSAAGRIATIQLDDSERRKLGDAKYIRLLVINNNRRRFSGRVMLGAPVVRGAGFRPITVRGNAVSGAADLTDLSAQTSVSVVERLEAGANSLEAAYGDTIRRLHSSSGSTQRILEVGWEKLKAGEAPGADGRIGVIPLGNYHSLSFFVRGPVNPPPGGTFRFLIARGPESLANEGDIALDTEIPLSAFSPGAWTRVDLHYSGQNQRVDVGGRTIPEASLKYRPGAHGGEASGAGAAGEQPAGRSSYTAFFIKSGTGDALPDGGFAIDEIILEDPAPSFRLNGGTGVEWKRPGELVSWNGREVLSDVSLGTALESSVKGDPFTPGSEHSGGVISRSRGETTFLGTALSAALGFTAADKTWYWNGSHGISRAFGPLSIKESFSAAPNDETMDHRFGLELATGNRAAENRVHSKLEGEAFYEHETLERKWRTAAGFSPARKIIPGFSTEGEAIWTEDNRKTAEWMGNYAEVWGKSWGYLAPDTGEGAKKRDIKGNIKITEGTTPIGAELGLEGSSAFSRPSTITQSSNLVRLDIPLSIGAGGIGGGSAKGMGGPYRFLFRGERSFKRNLRFAGRDILADGEKYGESIADSLPLWTSAPFYSLFDNDLGALMDKGLKNSPSASISEYSYFNDRAGISLQLPARYDLSSFYIPSSAGTQLSRVLEQKLDTRLDMLSLSGNLGFSSVNIFGAYGASPLFSFYESDEFTHALDASVAFPRGEATSYRFQSAMATGFYGFSGGVLDLGNTITLGSAGWVESLLVNWTVPTKKSLLSVLYNYFTRAMGTQRSWLTLGGILDSPYEQLRKETLELSLDRSGDYLKMALAAGHESMIRVQGRLNLSVFAKINCAQDDRTNVLSFIGVVGTSLKVSF